MRRFLWSIYGFSFLSQFILIYPVYPLLFQSKGLSALQIGALFAIYSATTILLEVPTGVLADRFSRRSILFASSLIRAAGYAIWLMSDSFPEFAFGFILMGLAATLMSGTFEAFVYDELKEKNQEHAFGKVNGHIRGYHFAGMTLGVLLGGFAAEIGFAYALVPSMLVPLLAGLLILLIRPAPRVHSTQEAHYWSILKDALQEARHNPPLLRLMIVIALVFGATGASDEIWSLWLSEIDFSFLMIGIILAVSNAVSSLAGFTSHRLPLSGKRLHAFTLLGGLLVLLLGWINARAAVFLIFPIIYVIEASKVLFDVRLQHAISSHRRATVSSINALLLEMIALVFYFLIGALADTWGYVSFLWLLGGIIVTVAVMTLGWPNRRAVRA